MIFPHELFDELYRQSPSACLQKFYGIGGKAACKRYWQLMGGGGVDWYREHPLKTAIEASPGCWVPGRLHGDGVALGENKKMLVVSWSSVLVKGPTLTTKFVIACIPMDGMIQDSLLQLYDAIAWSFNVMAGRVWPCHDWRRRRLDATRMEKSGKALADGAIGVILSHFAGDWEWHVGTFCFAHHYNTMRICMRCRVEKSNGPLNYADVSEDAPWTRELTTHTGYLLGIASVG